MNQWLTVAPRPPVRPVTLTRRQPVPAAIDRLRWCAPVRTLRSIRCGGDPPASREKLRFTLAVPGATPGRRAHFRAPGTDGLRGTVLAPRPVGAPGDADASPASRGQLAQPSTGTLPPGRSASGYEPAASRETHASPSRSPAGIFAASLGTDGLRGTTFASLETQMRLQGSLRATPGRRTPFHALRLTASGYGAAAQGIARRRHLPAPVWRIQGALRVSLCLCPRR